MRLKWCRRTAPLLFATSETAARSAAPGRLAPYSTVAVAGSGMTDAAIRDLARRAGVAVTWRDYANKEHQTSIEALRRLLAALDLPCETAADVADSLHRCEPASSPPLVTATVGEPFDLPVDRAIGRVHVRIICEDGAVIDVPARAQRRGVRLRGIDTPGYSHRGY